MAFDYYARLPARAKAIYRKSDAIESVKLRDPASLHALVQELQVHLGTEKRAALEKVCRKLVDGIIADLDTTPVRLKVLSVRPSRSWGELHGLYEAADGESAIISVWMRTAKNRRVVAFRTFLRTVLHELCHHLDYEYHGLADSFHTEGFFKRESSLFRQLVPDAAVRKRP